MPLKLSVFPSEPLCFLLSSKIHREKLFIWKGHLTQFGEFAIHIVKNFQSEVSESFISFLYEIVSDFLSSKSKIRLIHFTFYKLLATTNKRPNFHCWLIHKELRLNLLLCDYCGWPVMPQNGENALYAIPRAVNQICQTLQQLSITLRQRFCRNDLKWFWND